MSEPRETRAPALGDRSLFPDLAARFYLNHAAISPPSLPVRAAALGVLEDYARHGAAAFPRWSEQRARLKRKFASMIGAAAADIGLVPNTTQGVIDVALCLPWRRGDRIVVFDGEFPANVTPWQRAAELFGLEIHPVPLRPFLESDAAGLSRLEDELRGGVRLVAVSAVQFQTGLRMPLRGIGALCRAAGTELFVDAIQACGMVPVDVVEGHVDYLACGSHKWLMGLEGAGFLYVHPERVAALRPSVAGWLSHEDALAFLFEGPGRLRYDRPIRKRADFIEGGNCNSVGFAALEASIDIFSELGPAAIFAHVSGYLDLLEAGLRARGFDSLRAPEPTRRSGSLSVIPPANVSVVALHAALGQLGVACSIPDGILRFSPHWPNAHAEVAGVLEAVDAALASVSG